MKEVLSSIETEVKQKNLTDLMSENIPFAQGLKRDEVNGQVRKWVISSFLPEREKKEGEVETEEDRMRKKYIKEFDVKTEHESVFGVFKGQLEWLNLAGTLRDISLTEVKVNQIKDLAFLRRKDGKEKKILIMSVDYQLNGFSKGRVSKFFIFSLVKNIPKFETSSYIEIPEELIFSIKTGRRRTDFLINKNIFEGKSVQSEDELL